MSNYHYFKTLLEINRARFSEIETDERGVLEEKVIIVGLCAAAALAVIAILVTKITARANSTTI